MTYTCMHKSDASLWRPRTAMLVEERKVGNMDYCCKKLNQS